MRRSDDQTQGQMVLSEVLAGPKEEMNMDLTIVFVSARDITNIEHFT
jgi:hypothetical protein